MEKSKVKPDLALLIGHAMAKKDGKSMDEADKPKDDMSEGDAEEHDHLVEIATDLISAVKSGDADAVADLLKEAFECCEGYPHSDAGDESEY